ncbi:unnamed protein product, partial [marine sediment metagenome]
MTLQTSQTPFDAKPPMAAAEAPVGKTDFALYAGVVASWSLSWYAIILQLGTVAPEVSLVWRFLLASA